MIFNSLIFLFAFLPTVLVVYFLLPKIQLKNIFLLLASLFFYAWGEAVIVLVMVFSILFNYLVGNIILTNNQQPTIKVKTWLNPKLILFIGVLFNLAVLIYYKYAYFIVENLQVFGFKASITEVSILLPIGISFYTFQSISYLVDVYKRIVPPQKKLVHLGLYISLFPQLIAGPIVRYEDIYKEILYRKTTIEGFTSGILKFTRGLAKKVLIANNVALIADKVFDIPITELGTSMSWLGILCYSLQIYFDFSGYSDMAIGLGRMFGFNIKENFQHPYSAKNIKDFWRRWHISLSTWFRDYLYIPLGGSRGGTLFTYRNLLLVFFVTGLWHGASWNFIVWGLFHGFFLLVEKNISMKLPRTLAWLSNIYLLVVVMVGWVFFRAENLNYAVDYIGRLFVFSEGTNLYALLYVNNLTVLIITLGVIFSVPLRKYIIKYSQGINTILFTSITYGVHFVLLLLSVFEIIQSNYNPFIYFRF